mgnify:CR=1 FL=1
MIDNKVFIILGLMICYSVLFPILGVIIWKKKTKEPLKPIIVGAITFFLFAMVLENIPKINFEGSSLKLFEVILVELLLDVKSCRRKFNLKASMIK